MFFEQPLLIASRFHHRRFQPPLDELEISSGDLLCGRRYRPAPVPRYQSFYLAELSIDESRQVEQTLLLARIIDGQGAKGSEFGWQLNKCPIIEIDKFFVTAK
jgi:hypothetical protein